jgi:hypothetical protein
VGVERRVLCAESRSQCATIATLYLARRVLRPIATCLFGAQRAPCIIRRVLCMTLGGLCFAGRVLCGPHTGVYFAR